MNGVARGELFWDGSLGHDEGEIERSVEVEKWLGWRFRILFGNSFRRRENLVSSVEKKKKKEGMFQVLIT